MDYAIRISGLSSPPALAYTEVQYRPGVTVVNLGVTTNAAQGSLSIYNVASGLLVKSFNIASGDIAPGDSKVCQSDIYWQPTETGEHFAIASVQASNASAQLPPTYFIVVDIPPPPPPEVPEHAEQHQDGNVDEISVEGLSGTLADPQHPDAHASNHEVNAGDELDVTGLLGVLSEDQHPAAHGATKHDQSVEATANKGAANGYAPLDDSGFQLIAHQYPTTMHLLSPNTGELAPHVATDAPEKILEFSLLPNAVPRPYVMCHAMVKFSGASATFPIGALISIGPLATPQTGPIHPSIMPAPGVEIQIPVRFSGVIDTSVQNYINVHAGPLAAGTVTCTVLFAETYFL